MKDMPREPYKEIDRFWHWFQNNVETIKHWYSSGSQKELSQFFSARIKWFDNRLVWEIGPGVRKTYEFTISPNRSANLLRITEEIIARAPKLDDWEFYSAKPKKDWDYRIELSNRKGQSVTLDASDWKYYLTGYEGQSFFDIVLIASNLPRLDQNSSQLAASLVVEGALGERKMIELIGSIKITSQVGPDMDERLSKIHVLNQHLDSLMECD